MNILSVFLFLESLGGGELLVIMLFILIFFGSSKIPDLARGLGKGMREIKDAMNGVQSEIRQTIHDAEKTVSQATDLNSEDEVVKKPADEKRKREDGTEVE